MESRATEVGGSLYPCGKEEMVKFHKGAKGKKNEYFRKKLD